MNITLNKGDFRHPDLFWGAVEDMVLGTTSDSKLYDYFSEEELDDILTVEVFIKELDYETGLTDTYFTVHFRKSSKRESKSISL
jgi:hypothetical protein|tara:strand:+ start:194 stop:445 length:252 start_codon:yes stop_codon:yes gene_type:complete